MSNWWYYKKTYFDRLYYDHQYKLNNDTGYLFKVLNQDYRMQIVKFVHTVFNHRKNIYQCVIFLYNSMENVTYMSNRLGEV